MCLLICSAEYTASFVPHRQETISKSNCLSAACLNAAGTVLLAFLSLSPGVIPSHSIPVNLELAGTCTSVNPQLSWLFGPYVINHIFLSFVSDSGSTYCSFAMRRQKREVPGRPAHRLSVGTSQLFRCLSEAWALGEFSCVKTKADVDLIPLRCVDLSTTGLLVGFQL